MFEYMQNKLRKEKAQTDSRKDKAPTETKRNQEPHKMAVDTTERYSHRRVETCSCTLHVPDMLLTYSDATSLLRGNSLSPFGCLSC